MEKVKITKIYLTNKEGQEQWVETKNGKVRKMTIQVDKYPKQYLSGFFNLTTSRWSEGEEIEIDITKREFNGKTYLNFSLPRREGGNQDIEPLKKQVPER